MKYIKIAFALFGLMLLNQGETKAQDPQFTQFYANQLYLNPAFAGTSKCPRVGLSYRNQWPSISGTFVTGSFAYDQYLDGINGGLGVLITRDDAGKGILTTTRASFIYSYHLAVNSRSSINFGFEGGYHVKALNTENLIFGDQISPTQGVVGGDSNDPGRFGTSRSAPDFSFGALYYSKYFFMGAAGHHLTEPDEGLINSSKLPMKITGHMGAKIPLRLKGLGGGTKGAKSSISPNVLYQRQADFQQLNLGLYVQKGALVTGLWYRNSDAFIVLVGIEQDMVKIGYSYDLTISRLGSATAGSHELSMQWQFPCRPPRKKLRAIQCPSF